MQPPHRSIAPPPFPPSPSACLLDPDAFSLLYSCPYLSEMNGRDILLHLPPRLKITDMDWFSVWFRRFTVSPPWLCTGDASKRKGHC
ncbi:hypothetical protein E2C01_052765 [Portunus trituberculatus]|uniref:Uncharacterized protein n=1 Tax=Portunus trituberculatus TaxID=210409 RepID=A0A5B7GMQ0_PORTR|nr:hypothetical protein [Portunus trituberculatus]